VTFTRVEVNAELDENPLQLGIRHIVTIAMIASAGFALFAIILGWQVGGAVRAKNLSLLQTLGMNPRDARRLLIVEMLPTVLVALVAGLLAGLAMLALVGPGLDLRPFTGSLISPPLATSFTQLLGVTGLTALAVAIALIAAIFGDRRRRLAPALRVGEN
jgi:putative ABC transport system permease protein